MDFQNGWEKMVRRGYTGEYWVKSRLKILYEKYLILKTAISQNAPDFIVINTSEKTQSWANCWLKGIEVKTRKNSNKYHPNDHDIKQWHMMKTWNDRIPIEYWILTKKKGLINCQILTFEQFGIRYISQLPKMNDENMG